MGILKHPIPKGTNNTLPFSPRDHNGSCGGVGLLFISWFYKVHKINNAKFRSKTCRLLRIREDFIIQHQTESNQHLHSQRIDSPEEMHDGRLGKHVEGRFSSLWYFFFEGWGEEGIKGTTLWPSNLLGSNFYILKTRHLGVCTLLTSNRDWDLSFCLH